MHNISIARIIAFFGTAPEIHFDQEAYNVSEADGFVHIRIVTNRLDMNGTTLFYTEDGIATG